MNKINRNIPADIKRKIFLEAGFMCAIPTCKHTEVEIHHIVPFEKCNKHEFDNLIALCPNCHGKADKGIIDRKSLLLYKARLQKIFSNDLNELRDEAKWKSKKISEEKVGNPFFSYEIEYPFFNTSINKNLNEINKIIEGFIYDEIFGLRSILIEETDVEIDIGNTQAISFEIIHFSSTLISIRFSIYHYSSGAAHGNHYTKSFNFLLDPLCNLELTHLFQDHASALNLISEYCRKELKLQFGLKSKNNSSYKWIVSGTKPVNDSFNTFNLTNDSIIFTFDEYVVAPFSEGSQIVKLPLRRISKFINSNVNHKFIFSV